MYEGVVSTSQLPTINVRNTYIICEKMHHLPFGQLR
jgi:hypothetical protein